MNKKDIMLKRNETMRLYKVPGTACMPCHRNHVILRPQNNWEHEKKKCEICYHLLNCETSFITEAQRKDNGDIIDVVILDTGEEIEIDHKHGNVEELKKKGRTVVEV